MWPGREKTRTVSCIACGESVERSEAREYDKYGDRWDREDKEFEYLCKPCFRDTSNVTRDGLEQRLVDAGAGTNTREEFLRRYLDGAGAEPAGD